MLSRSIRFLVAGAVVVTACSCGGGSVAYREARKAELRKDYDTALVYYDKALQSEPENSKYLIHEKIMRQKAAVFHFNRGRELLKQNRQQEAIGEFQKAVGVDSTNQAAAPAAPRAGRAVGGGVPVGGPAAAGLPAGWEKTGRNEPCPCGSGKKFKKCHGAGL